MINNNGELHVVIGTGPLGMAVMEELLAKGFSVRMVNRRGEAAVPHGVQVVRGDATVQESMRQACRGAQVIYHCAKAPYTKWPEQFPPITQGIIEAAAAAQAKLIYADNLYMYGDAAVSAPLTEELPNRATSRKGITRAQMANSVLEAHRRGMVQAAIGRAPDFYGPGVLDSALGTRVFAAALAGRPAEVLGNLDAPHAYIYIRDFARGLVTLGREEAALGHIWHIPSAETLTTRQIIAQIYAHLGREPKFRVAPKLFVSLMALFNADMREIREMLYLFEQPFLVDHSKFESYFDMSVTSHEQAIRETMDWYRGWGERAQA